MSIIRNLTEFNKMMFETLLEEGMTVVDCTLGNGNDAEILLNGIGKTGILYGFDIQKDAITRSYERLSSRGFDNYKLYHASHDLLSDYFKSETVDFIVYNLGYLPKSDKVVSTKKESTMQSIGQGLNILKKGGVMSVTVYPGHEDGKLEERALSEYMSQLNSKEYHVMKNHYDNQKPEAPYVYWVQKK